MKNPIEQPGPTLEQAKAYSHFDFKFENPSFPRNRIGELDGLDAYYKEYDEFINKAYLKGLELQDPGFIERVFQIFPRTHQSGFSLKEFLYKIGDPDVIEFYETHGQKFLEEIRDGAETEIYKSFSCKFKLAEDKSNLINP